MSKKYNIFAYKKFFNRKYVQIKLAILCVSVILVFYLLLPPFFGCYYFPTSIRLDGSVGIIVLNKKDPILCSIGGSSKNDYLHATLINGILTIISGENTKKIEIKNKFFWILWRDKNPTFKDNDEWNLEFPCYNPIILFQCLL
jgi:hypothetical protein